MISIKNGDGIVWPNGKRIAVMVTFDFDAETLRWSVIGKKKIGFSDFSRGQYGPHEGLRRCLRMLDRQNLKTTFFIPGIVAEHYPDSVKAIVAAGHELAYHGYDHDNTVGIPREQEEENMDKSGKILAQFSGRRPVGARGPLDVLQEYSIDLLKEKGYLYDSTMKDCDWPYVFDNGLVELPTDVAIDDFPYFYFSYADEATINCSYLPDYVYEMWKDAYDELASEGDKVMVIKLHPQLIGRVSRVHMLEKFILYMKQSGAWITSCENVAKYVKDFYDRKESAAR
jgi:peptidoglycan-N-acetylglucosamine deacetylase